ncbi:DUF4190 domain-containing protein [Streptomyces sp. ERV7]|uniref:DUF4190 domain-containing protein n=1 Tax=Streptomyces sp. ERV7 TaxID=1322334 RepID=UPI0007F4FF00|nr:DUF4190 domain-containing protein [Streptomyces sp. ERV7]OAR22656.1 DUF4190 domain-containing protein [Streptomyces sp. ERV7]
MPPTHTAVKRTAETDPRPPGHGYGTRPPGGRNGPAGAAMVLGVIALSTSIVFIGGLLGLVGLVLGITALATSRRTGTGRGKAVTAVVTSALAIVVAVLVAVFTVWYADKTQECYDPGSFQQYKQCVRQQFTGG